MTYHNHASLLGQRVAVCSLRDGECEFAELGRSYTVRAKKTSTKVPVRYGNGSVTVQ